MAPRGAACSRRSQPKHIQTQKILVTLAERPHPFPSRTRKLSSPAPKIREAAFRENRSSPDLVLPGNFGPRPMAMLARMTTADADRPRPAATQGRRRQPSMPWRGTASTVRGDTAADRANPRAARSWSPRRGRRLDIPTRDHAVVAVSPAAPALAREAARLCLTPAHTGCATYLASLTLARNGSGRRRSDVRPAGVLARTTSVIEDPGASARASSHPARPAAMAGGPGVILVTTLFVLALSGFRAGVPTSPSRQPAQSARLQRVTAATIAPTPRVTSSPSATPATEDTAPPQRPSHQEARDAKAAATFRTYVVKSATR